MKWGPWHRQKSVEGARGARILWVGSGEEEYMYLHGSGEVGGEVKGGGGDGGQMLRGLQRQDLAR